MIHTNSAQSALPSLVPLPSLLVPAMQALLEDDTFLAVGAGLPNGVIVHLNGEQADAKVTVSYEDAIKLEDWGYIEMARTGRISLYEITKSGRVLVPSAKPRKAVFQPIQKIKTQREHPVRVLARKKMSDGTPFLGAEHVDASEHLCLDFQLAGFEEHPVGSLREVLDYKYEEGEQDAVLGAHARLVAALDVLGPDLGDIALRCCCLGEGVETAERRMGWSARSGKIVLRIALRRLVVHYDEVGADYCYVS